MNNGKPKFIIVGDTSYWPDLDADDVMLSVETYDLLNYAVLQELIQIDPVLSAMTGTNTYDWEIDIDDTQILDAEVSDGKIKVKFSFQVNGDPMPDKPCCGRRFIGEAVFVISPDGSHEFVDIKGEIDHGDYL